MSYDLLAYLAKTLGLIWMMGFFIITVIYVYRPGAKLGYQRAARSVLPEEQERRRR